jgi:hypothetical protein
MSVTFEGAQLQVDLLDPFAVTPVRLFRHPGGDWDEPPLEYRNQRVDPPVGHESEYAVLYTAESIAAAAIECHILNCDSRDRYTYDQQRTLEYAVVHYEMRAPALFIPIDGENKRTLALRFPDPAYGQHRAVAYELFSRFGGVVHGLSWQSYHRNQPGRVYALWHHHKPTVKLAVSSATPYLKLAQDPEWLQLLKDNPEFEPLASAT